VLNDGRYGHGVFDGRVRVSLLRGASYPDPDADRGTHQLRLALLPHGPGLADVVREAERFVTPVRVVRAAPTRCSAPVVTLVRRRRRDRRGQTADDGSDDLIVRLHEACGDRRA
jgi:alpha-mannosidase